MPDLRLRDRLDQHKRVESQSGCWVWTGSLTHDGYGRINMDSWVRRVHRVSYEEYIAPIPNGLTIDHLCRNRACFNPGHLEVVDLKTNILRSPIQITAVHSRKTHCSKGHLFSPENLVPSASYRCCKICHKESVAKYLRNKNHVA